MPSKSTCHSEHDIIQQIDPLYSTKRTSNYTGLTTGALQKHRTNGTGPQFIKVGKRRVAYRLSDIRSWLDGRVATSTADARVRGLTS